MNAGVLQQDTISVVGVVEEISAEAAAEASASHWQEAGARTAISDRDITDLAIFGLVDQGIALWPDLLTAAKHLGQGTWRPTSDVIEMAVRRAAKQEELSIIADPDDALRPRLDLTPNGRARLQHLLLRIGSHTSGPLASVGRTLVIAFLGTLDAQQQRSLIDRLREEQQRQDSALDAAERACPLSRGLARPHFELARRRLDAERDWLQQQAEALA